MAWPNMPHTVVGGRLFFVDTAGKDLHSQAELQAIGQAAVQVYRDEEPLQLVRPSPSKPPVAKQFFRHPRPGHPDPEDLLPLAQTFRPDVLQRIHDATSLVDQGEANYLHEQGHLWLVDSAPLFVGDKDQEAQAAIAARLEAGNLQPPRPEPVEPAQAFVPLLARILPVGD